MVYHTSTEIRTAECKAGFFLKEKNYKKCIAHFEILPSGTTDLLMGLFYLHGLGVRRNRDAARKHFSSLRAGQTVYFGNNLDYDSSLMKCKILSIRDDRVFLQTVEEPKQLPESFKPGALFAKNNVPWDRSLLRIQLNDSYFKETFNRDLRKMVLDTHVTTPENPFCTKKHKMKDTTDKVFLLSLQEYLEYNRLNPLWASPITWTSTRTSTSYETGVTWTLGTRDVRTLYFGKDSQDSDLKGAVGEFFRTPGEDINDRSYIAGDYLFYSGDYFPSTNMKLSIKSAFWVSLK